MSVPLTAGELKDHAESIGAGLAAIVQPGNTLTDAVGLLGHVQAAAEDVELLGAMPGYQKREVVVAALAPIIMAALRKLNIPWVPAAAEGVVWNLVERHALPLVIGVICDLVAGIGRHGTTVNEAPPTSP